MVNGEIASELKIVVTKIFPVILVDVRKSKVLVLPETKGESVAAATAAT